MTIIKKLVLCILIVVIVAFSFVTPTYALEEILDNEIMLLADDPLADCNYDVLAETSSQPFGLKGNDLILSENFLALEDLPYGENSLVMSLRVGSIAYYFIVDANKTSELYITDSSVNGTDYFAAQVMSNAPIYRIAYNINSGALATFKGYKGLRISTKLISEDVPGYYYFDYHFTLANDMYLTIGTNNYNFDNYWGYSNLVSAYPTKADVANIKQTALQEEANDLQEEANETSKGIWDTLKELPTKIANSIKGFFTTLKNYLLYFQAEEPTEEQLNPFEGILDDVQSFFDNQIKDVEEFKNSLKGSLDNVVSYINSASGIITKFLNGVPLISFFLIFFVVFAVVRKVVGH